MKPSAVLLFTIGLGLSLLQSCDGVLLAAMSDAKAISEAVRLFGKMGGIQTIRGTGATYWTKVVGVYSPECKQPFTPLGSGLNTWEAAFAAVSPNAVKGTIKGTVELETKFWDDTGVARFQWILDGVPLGSEVIYEEPHPREIEISMKFQTSTASKGVHVICGFATDAVGNVGRLPAFVIRIDQSGVATGNRLNFGMGQPGPVATLQPIDEDWEEELLVRRIAFEDEARAKVK